MLLRSEEEKRAFAEFQTRQTAMLDEHDIPEEFRGWLCTLAWEEGHSCGYGEVLNYLGGLIFGLAESLKAYNARAGVTSSDEVVVPRTPLSVVLDVASAAGVHAREVEVLGKRLEQS